MLIVGIIMLVAGIASAIYGSSLNNSLEAQFESMLKNGSANPGNVWLYLGIGVAVVGVILIIVNFVKKK